ncbi:signal peptide protein [Caballeronia hypogeia]|uniref:Signal peptide protein n=1 Tax=Caballeronia hypogeia TaxID=1777140 RepID=A0A158B052_9BURK|nr:hypothetical protein [Caballeronia hypogeia]SAK62647.1 signal peptide protein [Caballeronia hypogeia]
MNKVSKASVLAAAALLGGLTLSGAAMAGVSVGVNIGVPAPVYVAPEPVYAPPPPPVVYAPPPPVYAQPVVVIGWHGDRYWDGRRYWDRDDYYRYHGHGHGHGHDHDDHDDHDNGRHNGWH